MKTKINFFQTREQFDKYVRVNSEIDRLNEELQELSSDLIKYNTEAMKAWCGACFKNTDETELIMILSPSFENFEGEEEYIEITYDSYCYYVLRLHYFWINNCPTIEPVKMNMYSIINPIVENKETNWKQISFAEFQKEVQNHLEKVRGLYDCSKWKSS